MIRRSTSRFAPRHLWARMTGWPWHGWMGRDRSKRDAGNLRFGVLAVPPPARLDLSGGFLFVGRSDSWAGRPRRHFARGGVPNRPAALGHDPLLSLAKPFLVKHQRYDSLMGVLGRSCAGSLINRGRGPDPR